MRALGPPDPTSLPPSSEQPPRVDIVPNTNEPIGSVGPNVPQGLGDQHVIYPADSPPFTPMPWQGWPSEWALPSWESGFSIAGLLDVVFAAVDRNASAFSSMPPSAIKDRHRLANQPTWTRNPQPELYASWNEFASQVWWAFQVVGEAIILATSRFENGYPRTFMVLQPWLVNVDIVDGLRRYSIGGEDVTADVCCIRYVTTSGDAHGHSPLESAAGRILAIRALQRYATDLASMGGVPWGVLKSKFRLTAQQANDLRTQWIEAARSRSGAPAILDSETDLQLSQMQPKDMQLVELQQSAEARLSVLLGVPPYMLALPTNASSLTYTNATLLYAEHYGWLRTKIAQIAAALSGWALPWGTDVEFDAERYIQPPATERASYYSTMFAIVDPVTGKRAMTVEEIRRTERVDLLEAPS